VVRAILARYPLRWDGTHGLPHWARVLETGQRLAGETGADREIVALFAVFHDSCRENEGWDDGHGRRGAELAASLRGRLFDLEPARFDMLYHACEYHTDGGTEGDVTILTCWDADRLDLGRVLITPSPEFLCTPAARRRETIDWAEARSRSGFVPEIVIREWMPLPGEEQ
ncbi:MAG: HD domain-containing protein, partial [marine benthic group bacterium]|jgi:uncharacterized protein|nr:HD domain-containing protein [Gemmatimonadota bacterium]